jgi:chitosanase
MASHIPILNVPGCSLVQADTIQSLVSIAENSTINWQNAYTYIENINDGRGYTCGLVGFTTGTHDLLMVVQELQKRAPDHDLVRYIPALKRVDGTDSTAGLDDFFKAVKTLKSDEHWKMAQWAILMKLYWIPAWDVCKKYRLKTPLALYIIYDTLLNFGEVERTVIAKMKNVRDTELNWLTNFLACKREYMQRKGNLGSVDRVDMQLKLVEQKNENLNRPIHAKCYGDSFVIA